MGFGDIIANAGHILGTANDVQATLQERRTQQAMRDLILKQGTRADATAGQDFETEQAMRKVSPVQVPAVPAVPGDGEAGNQQPQPEIPAAVSPNFDERANIALQRGRPDLYAKEQAAKRALQTEGLVDLSRALISGQDPKTAVQQYYNAKGNDRIDPASVNFADGVLTGKRANGMDFRLDPQAALIELGVKQPNLVKIAEGETVFDPVTRKPVAYGMPKTPRYRPADEEMRVKEFEADLHDRTERLKASLAKKADGKPREVQLAQAFVDAGVAPDLKEALIMATEGKNLSPERFKADLIKKLAGDNMDLTSSNTDAAKRAKAQLSQTADDLTRLAFPTRGGAPAAPKGAIPKIDDGSQVQADVEAAARRDSAPPAPVTPPKSMKTPTGGNATFTGQYTVGQKPIYSDDKGNKFVGE